MSTLKQKKAIDIFTTEVLENTGKTPIPTKGEIMRRAGYPEPTAKNPKQLFDSKAWEEFMASIDEKPIVEIWKRWAMSSKDKRVALQAGENIMKLKGRFKEQIDIGIQKKRDEIIEA